MHKAKEALDIKKSKKILLVLTLYVSKVVECKSRIDLYSHSTAHPEATLTSSKSMSTNLLALSVYFICGI